MTPSTTELAKSLKRRAKDWAFVNLYFNGIGLDVGAGHKHSALHTGGIDFPNFRACHTYDMHETADFAGDAQTLLDIPDNEYDFVVSSHCLEHLTSPRVALNNWIRVVKQNGYIIVTIPDWEMYEHKSWPSIFNQDHKQAFSMSAAGPNHLIWVPQMLQHFAHIASLERLTLIRDHYNPAMAPDYDQCLGPAECAIEFVLRKL